MRTEISPYDKICTIKYKHELYILKYIRIPINKNTHAFTGARTLRTNGIT